MSLLIALTATPGLLGTQEAVRQAQSKEKREEHRARRCIFVAHCVKPSIRAREINDRPLILKDGRIFVDPGSLDGEDTSFTCTGYYLPYPDVDYEGLVTRISPEAPIMNWVFIDANTYQLRYGVRLDAQGHMTGPFDCTSHNRRLTFQGWEGFCAVEERPGEWGVYFDIDDNALQGRVPVGVRILEIEIERREERWKKADHAPIGNGQLVASSQGQDGENNETKPDTPPQTPPLPPPKPEKEPPTQTSNEKTESRSSEPALPPTQPRVSSRQFQRTPRTPPMDPIIEARLDQARQQERQVSHQQHILRTSERPVQRPRSRMLMSRKQSRLLNDMNDLTWTDDIIRPLNMSLMSLHLSYPGTSPPRASSSGSITRRAIRRLSSASTGVLSSVGLSKDSSARRRASVGAKRVARAFRGKRKTL